jgi:hypothetical protein
LSEVKEDSRQTGNRRDLRPMQATRKSPSTQRNLPMEGRRRRVVLAEGRGIAIVLPILLTGRTVMNIAADTVDLIAELRLRRWARQNYVSPEARRRDWHEAILDEMELRDRELGIAPSEVPPGCVPLHSGPVRAPHFMSRVKASSMSISEMHYT